MSDALLIRWLKEAGDEVAEGEAVVEIETDKTTMLLVSPVAGRLGPHLFEPDAIVPVGTVIVEVVADSDKAGEAAATENAHTTTGPIAAQVPSQVLSSDLSPSSEEPRRPHALNPRARRLARESGEPADRAGRFRELIAAKVLRSWQEIPHFNVSREVGADVMLATLDALRSHEAEPAPTITDLLLRAHAVALKGCGVGPGDVGLAVATPYGVAIPVVRDVLGMDVFALARARNDAVVRARAGQLTSEDLEATPPSTLSNLGAFGVDSFTGVIALGQTSLLTVGRIKRRVVVDGERTFRIGAVFSATLNVDHRAIDGADAARLLVAFAEATESLNTDWTRP
jgi:pyruvate dehydrogenase E2 component (dihydrolipoamide acetyltransferase)